MKTSTIVAASALWSGLIGAVLAAVLLVGFTVSWSNRVEPQTERVEHANTECFKAMRASYEALSGGDFEQSEAADASQADCAAVATGK